MAFPVDPLPPGAQPLYQRARSPTESELADIPWLRALDAQERRVAVADLKVVQVAAGDHLCRVGRPVTYWFGVIDGFLKMSNNSKLGMPISFSGLPTPKRSAASRTVASSARGCWWESTTAFGGRFIGANPRKGSP